MTVIVQSKQIKVTAGLQEFATAQAEKLLKLSKKILGVRVFLETVEKKTNEPSANTVTYKVQIPGKDIVVRSQATDMYEAIRAATNTAARHVRKHFEKIQTKKRKI